MTHSIYMVIKSKDYEKIQELKESIHAYEDFINVWGLKIKKRGSLHQEGGSQPFIYFPDKDWEEDEDFDGFEIHIETGSHVSVDDRDFALQWFYFTLAFMEAFKEDLEGFNIYYQESGDDVEISEADMRKMILEERE